MKTMTAAALLIGSLTAAVHAQPAKKIRLVLDVRGENAGLAGRLMADVRRELQSIGDVEIVAPGDSARTIRVIAGEGGGGCAASVLVTERYDRETLMVLGIEDDDTANKMMALQIVNDHQIVTGADVSDVARRIVASLNTGILARLRR
jgi:acetylornithine deacetylase/succinyl-diaminopimelate desuccinylase-like protein